MNRKLVVTFLIGLVVGAVGMLISQPFLGRSLPEAVRGKQQTVSGPVTAKRLDGERLLLTVVTPEGATLATFTRRVNEIELLVETGDTVTLAMPDYDPFLSDPEITRVMKPGSRPLAPEGQPPRGARVDTAVEETRSEPDTMPAPPVDTLNSG